MNDMKRCPWCAEEIRQEAIKCRYCGSLLERGALARSLTETWIRPTFGRRLAGVCAGLAEQFGVSVTLLRLAFVLGTLFTGVFLLVYVLLWILMPSDHKVDASVYSEPGS